MRLSIKGCGPVQKSMPCVISKGPSRPVLRPLEGKAAALFTRGAYAEYVSTETWRPAWAKPLSAFVATSAKEARRRQGTPLAAFFNSPMLPAHWGCIDSPNCNPVKWSLSSFLISMSQPVGKVPVRRLLPVARRTSERVAPVEAHPFAKPHTSGLSHFLRLKRRSHND
jgi:hypothetical protein